MSVVRRDDREVAPAEDGDDKAAASKREGLLVVLEAIKAQKLT